MAKKFEVRTQAEIFIHNDLANCAGHFRKVAREKIDTKKRTGVGLDMMAALTFLAFSVEAKVNFVGWRVFGDDWAERKPLKDKINCLNDSLEVGLSWGSRPLQTIDKLKTFRDTLAHGKPDIVDVTTIENVEPEVWDAMKGPWEEAIEITFVEKCKKDVRELWKLLLEKADIPLHQTLTHGGHSLKVILDEA